MELYLYINLLGLCLTILTERVLKEALGLPLELEDFSNRDVRVITSYFLILIFTFCICVYFCFLALDGKTEFWAIFCVLLALTLMSDISEVDARTGVPLEEETGARQIIQDAIMDNKSFKETMIILFQYARPVAIAQNCPSNIDVLFSYNCQVINVRRGISNILLAVHFLVITDDYFMVVF